MTTETMIIITMCMIVQVGWQLGILDTLKIVNSQHMDMVIPMEEIQNKQKQVPTSMKQRQHLSQVR